MICIHTFPVNYAYINMLLSPCVYVCVYVCITTDSVNRALSFMLLSPCHETLGPKKNTRTHTLSLFLSLFQNTSTHSTARAHKHKHIQLPPSPSLPLSHSLTHTLCFSHLVTRRLVCSIDLHTCMRFKGNSKCVLSQANGCCVQKCV